MRIVRGLGNLGEAGRGGGERFGPPRNRGMTNRNTRVLLSSDDPILKTGLLIEYDLRRGVLPLPRESTRKEVWGSEICVSQSITQSRSCVLASVR